VVQRYEEDPSAVDPAVREVVAMLVEESHARRE